MVKSIFAAVMILTVATASAAELQHNFNSPAFLAASEKNKIDEPSKCVRWKWTGDVFERKVYCIEWIKKDCSNRLHKEICKLE